MTETALAVSIAAIAITLFGVILQWLAYRATTDQAQRAAQSAADMRAEIHGLVGELRGMTERMVEAQERQFNRMLDAFVTRPGAAAEVAEKTGESADTLQQISGAMETLKDEVRRAAPADEVQHKLDELARRIEQVSESTARAARLAQAAASAAEPAPRRASPGPPSFRVNVVPPVVSTGKSVTIRVFVYASIDQVNRVECAVKSPSDHTWRAAYAPPELGFEPSHDFVFPYDFGDASTDEAGTYAVQVRVRTVHLTFVQSETFSVVKGEPDA
jgi:hypothetical protein